MEGTEPIEEAGLDNQMSGEAEPEKKPNADVHAYNKRLVKEVRKLKAVELDRQITATGLDPTTGLGKAVKNTFSGDVTEEGAVADFAKTEYDHDPAVPEQLPEAIVQGQQLENLQGQSQPVEPVQAPVPGQTEIDAVDSNDPEAGRQEALAAINAKAGQFQEAFYPQNQ